MASSLSILDVNLAEGFHKIKCKYGMIISNLKYEKLYTENVSGALKYRSIEDLIKYKYI